MAKIDILSIDDQRLPVRHDLNLDGTIRKKQPFRQPPTPILSTVCATINSNENSSLRALLQPG